MLLLISIVTILFFGLGWLVAMPMLPKKDSSFFELFPFVVLCGITADYAVVLIFQSLAISLKIVTIMSFAGLLMFVVSIYKGERPKFFSKSGSFTFGAGVLLIFYLIGIISEPLLDWDARSIWFFHAKMIYAAEALSFDAGWAHPSVWFSHAGYPKLIPVMAAQLTSFMGYWNEYLPKLSLFFMLIPPVFWLISFARKSWSFCLLLCVFPFAINRMMWNGYMDGYLSVYLAVALLLLGRFIKSWRPMDFIACAACFLFLPNLKREGLLLLFLGFVAIVITGLILKKQHRLRINENISIGLRQLVFWVVLIAPTLLWYVYYAHAWGITKDAGILGDNGSSLMSERLRDGVSIKLIMSSMFAQLYLPILLATLVIALLLLVRKRLLNEIVPPLLIAVAYSLGLVVTYLALDYELNWALRNSTNRTTLMLNSCLIVSVFWALQYFERLGVLLQRRKVVELPENR